MPKKPAKKPVKKPVKGAVKGAVKNTGNKAGSKASKPATKRTKSTKKLSNQELFLEIYKAENFNITTACKKLKISRDTYYKWLDDDKFSYAISHAREELVDIVECALIKKIREGNMTAIIFFLKCQGKARGYIEAPVATETTEKIDWNGIGSVFAKVVGNIAINPPPNHELIEHDIPE